MPKESLIILRNKTHSFVLNGSRRIVSGYKKVKGTIRGYKYPIRVFPTVQFHRDNFNSNIRRDQCETKTRNCKVVCLQHEGLGLLGKIYADEYTRREHVEVNNENLYNQRKENCQKRNCDSSNNQMLYEDNNPTASRNNAN